MAFAIEYAVFQIRRVADELIGLVAVLDHHAAHHVYPEKVHPDSIGKLLDNVLCARSPFAEHKPLLIQLNDVSNAHKHSFIDSDTRLIGAHEPVVNALHLKGNKAASPVQHYSIPLRALVLAFDAFYAEAWRWLRARSAPA